MSMLPSPKELRQRYASWSNRKLLSVIHYKEQYTSEAVEIARAELGMRNVTADEVDAFLHDLEQQQRNERLMSGISLTFREKLRCFFFWFVPYMSVFNAGFLLKEKQSRIFSVAGFLCYFLTTFVIIYFRLPALIVCGLLPASFLAFFSCEKQMQARVPS